MSVLTGKEIIERNIVQNLIDPSKQVQPVGIDLTVQKIESYRSNGTIDFDNSKRELPRMSDPGKIDNYWLLPKGAYLITFNEIVSVPDNAMGIARARSTLLRLGATVETSVWDPGYKGKSQSMLVVHNPNGIKIYDNAKVIQIVFISLNKSSETLYNGRYQGENLEKNLIVTDKVRDHTKLEIVTTRSGDIAI